MNTYVLYLATSIYRYDVFSHSLHGVGVITKVYFDICAAFTESMNLNLAHRSFKVIDFGTNRKRIYIFLLVVNSNMDPILHRFRDRPMTA